MTVNVTIKKGPGMVRYRVTGPTKEAVAEWGADLLRRYEWMAYNTDVSEPRPENNSSRWWSMASRYNSAGG